MLEGSEGRIGMINTCSINVYVFFKKKNLVLRLVELFIIFWEPLRGLSAPALKSHGISPADETVELLN